MKSHKILVSALATSLIATGCAAMDPARSRSRAVSAPQGRQFSLVNISQKCHNKPLWITLHVDNDPVYATPTKLEGEGRIARSFKHYLYIKIAANQNDDYCKVLQFNAANLPGKTLHMSAFFASPRQGIILQGAPCHDAAQKYYQSCGIGRLSETTNVNGTELNAIVTRTPQTVPAPPAAAAVGHLGEGFSDSSDSDDSPSIASE